MMRQDHCLDTLDHGVVPRCAIVLVISIMLLLVTRLVVTLPLDTAVVSGTHPVSLWVRFQDLPSLSKAIKMKNFCILGYNTL
jgi:hypothetical protein